MGKKAKGKKSKRARSTSKKPPQKKRAKTTPKISKKPVPIYLKDTYVAVVNKKSADKFTVYKVNIQIFLFMLIVGEECL
jgi:ribosome assembly protein YihI (activator of Der GTPase)